MLLFPEKYKRKEDFTDLDIQTYLELWQGKQIKFEPVNIYYEALKDTIDAKEKEVYKGND